MTKPTATAVLREARALATATPPIPYETMDCQKYIKECVRRAGGAMQFAGSNDMYRNACAAIHPIATAPLAPGWLLFIVQPDGGEPAAYQSDGLGNASHVGLYIGDPGLEAAHSSASRGVVCATTLAAGWTHAGPALAIDYTAAPASTPDLTPTQQATVDVPAGEHLRLRDRPDPSGAYILRIPRGAALTITAHENGFARVTYMGYPGWVDERYLRYARETSAVLTLAQNFLRDLAALLEKEAGDAQ